MDYIPGAGNVTVGCGGVNDTVPLLPSETTFEIRVYSDATFLEAYFQQGRAAMTVVAGLNGATTLSVGSSVASVGVKATAWPIKGAETTACSKFTLCLS